MYTWPGCATTTLAECYWLVGAVAQGNDIPTLAGKVDTMRCLLQWYLHLTPSDSALVTHVLT